MTRPNPHIALIYHYDLARALNGEPVDWQAIPVNVDAGREGGDLCRAAADFAKRRDLFAMVAPTTPTCPPDETQTSEVGQPVGNGEGIRAGDMPLGSSPPCTSFPTAPLAAPAAPNAVGQPVVEPEPPVPAQDAAHGSATKNENEDLCSDTTSTTTTDTTTTAHASTSTGSVPTTTAGASTSGLSPSTTSAGVGSPDSVISASGIVSTPDPYRAAARAKLRARIADLIDQGHEQTIRRHWPADVAPLSRPGHTDDQLEAILAAVRRVETEVGAPWHPDDGPPPHSRNAIERALKAWEGRDPGTAWFAASLIAAFEQCRNADSTFEELVAQFSISQADRLYDAAASQ